jgi:curli production assembly/transport component CsgF
MRRQLLAISAIAISAAHLPASAFATDMVYHPVIPAFGGNPLNGSALLATAQAQGEGVKSGQQGPDLSGLNDALRDIGNGPAIIIGGNNGGNGNGNGGGNGSGNGNNLLAPKSVRGMVP